MLGFSRSQSLGLLTGTLNVKSALAPAAMLWAAVVTGASAVPLGSLTIPCTVTLCAAVPELTTVVWTFTVAEVVVGAGVWMYVAHWSTCTGLVSIMRTWR